MFHFSQFLKILKEILYYLLLQSLVEWHFELHNTLDLLHEHRFVLHPLEQLQRTNPLLALLKVIALLKQHYI